MTTLAGMTASGPAGPPYAVSPGYGEASGVPAPHDVPAPPRGPGAAPPFAAPPTEGRTTRLWIGLGVAALGVLLCCGGGIAAVIGLGVTGMEAVKEQAHVVVGDYLDAVSDREYDKAYQLLCDDAQRRESPREFEQRASAEPQISDYRIGEAGLNNEVSVPVDVTYTGGGRDTLRFFLDQDSNTGAMEICGIN